MLKWIRKITRRFLGLDDLFMGVDIGIRDNSCIVICSKSHNRVKIIDTRVVTIYELEKQIQEIQKYYGIPNNHVITDKPNFR